MSLQYVEFARFKTLSAVLDGDVIAANRALAAQQLRDVPGFMGRELYKVAQGEWLIVLRLQDQAAMNALLSDLKVSPCPEIKAFGALIDRTSMQLTFADQVASISVG